MLTKGIWNRIDKSNRHIKKQIWLTQFCTTRVRCWIDFNYLHFLSSTVLCNQLEHGSRLFITPTPDDVLQNNKVLRLLTIYRIPVITTTILQPPHDSDAQPLSAEQPPFLVPVPSSSGHSTSSDPIRSIVDAFSGRRMAILSGKHGRRNVSGFFYETHDQAKLSQKASFKCTEKRSFGNDVVPCFSSKDSRKSESGHDKHVKLRTPGWDSWPLTN